MDLKVVNSSLGSVLSGGAWPKLHPCHPLIFATHASRSKLSLLFEIDYLGIEYVEIPCQMSFMKG